MSERAALLEANRKQKVADYYLRGGDVASAERVIAHADVLIENGGLPAVAESHRPASAGDGGSPLLTSGVAEPRNRERAFPEEAWSPEPLRLFREVVAPSTEAPLEFLWAAFMTTVGLLIGRSLFVRNPIPIFPNFYVLMSGRT